MTGKNTRPRRGRDRKQETGENATNERRKVPPAPATLMAAALRPGQAAPKAQADDETPASNGPPDVDGGTPPVAKPPCRKRRRRDDD